MEDKFDYSLHYKRWHQFDETYYKHQYDFFNRWLAKTLEEFSPKSAVLDYGCGSGFLVNYLKDKFNYVLGVDSSIEQVQLAQKKGLPIDFLAIDEYQNWCRSNANKFDLIFLMDVLEHINISYQIEFLSNLVKTLKPGGSIFIKVPNANSLLASRWRYIDFTHHSSFTEASLDFICLNSGLKDITYLNDESSFYNPLKFFQIRGLFYKLVKNITRGFWRLYLRAELGQQASQISVGYNLFLKAKKDGN